MSALSNIFGLLIQIPVGVWSAIKHFFGKVVPRWWYSHYS